MHETTSPSCKNAAPFRITDWESDETNDDDGNLEHPWKREKSFDIGVHDLHLEIAGDFTKHTLYPEVYGIPESLMLLISQTTRLGNEREAMMSAPSSPSSPSPAQFFRRARALERAICQWDDDEPSSPSHSSSSNSSSSSSSSSDSSSYYPPGTDTDAHPAAVAANRRALAHLVRAMRAALAVYFYRRVHDVASTAILQPSVARTIEHLERIQDEDDAMAAAAPGEYDGYTTGIVWPGFVAACEAEGEGLRGRFERWFEVQERKSGVPLFGKAAGVVRMVWERRDGGGAGCTSWVDVVREEGVMLLCT